LRRNENFAANGQQGELHEINKMKSAWLLSTALPAATFSAGARAQVMDSARSRSSPTNSNPHLHALRLAGIDPSHIDGAGGRSGVLAGPDGVLMIDSQLCADRRQGPWLPFARSTMPIRYLVNTHITAITPPQCVFRQARRQ